jgi:hypothetical protein
MKKVPNSIFDIPQCGDDDVKEVFFVGDVSRIKTIGFTPIAGATDDSFTEYRAVPGTDRFNQMAALFVSEMELRAQMVNAPTWEQCIFSEKVNANMYTTQKMELRNIQEMYSRLPEDATMVFPARKAETVDVALCRGDQTVNVSVKTATLQFAKGHRKYNGWYFCKKAAPNHHLCDNVLVVYWNDERTTPIKFSMLTAHEVCVDDTRDNYSWLKTSDMSQYDLSELSRALEGLFAVKAAKAAV